MEEGICFVGRFDNESYKKNCGKVMSFLGDAILNALQEVTSKKFSFHYRFCREEEGVQFIFDKMMGPGGIEESFTKVYYGVFLNYTILRNFTILESIKDYLINSLATIVKNERNISVICSCRGEKFINDNKDVKRIIAVLKNKFNSFIDPSLDFFIVRCMKVKGKIVMAASGESIEGDFITEILRNNIQSYRIFCPVTDKFSQQVDFSRTFNFICKKLNINISHSGTSNEYIRCKNTKICLKK